MRQNKLYKITGILVLFLAIPSLLINCQKDEYIEDLTVLEKRHFTTISKSYAKEIFNGYIEAGKKKNKMFSSKSKELKVNPNWNSFQEVSLSEADANFGILDVTTNAMTSMRSKMVFLGVNDGVINAIQTENVSRDENKNIVDGVVFFHTLNGKFVVAYRYENGKPTMKYLKRNTVYKANFLSLSPLLFNECVNDLDTTTPTCETTIDGGELEGFTLVTQVRNNENYTNFPIDLLIQEQEPIIAEVTDLLNPNDRNGGGGADNSASCAGGTVYDPATNSCVDAEIIKFLEQDRWNESDPYDKWNKLTECEKAFFRSNPQHLYTASSNKVTAESVANRRFGNCERTDGDLRNMYQTIGDAYRHAYFAALNAHIMGYNKAEELGTAHECDNENGTEDKNMDLHNNSWGYFYASNFTYIDEDQFYTQFMDAFNNGQIIVLAECN